MSEILLRDIESGSKSAVMKKRIITHYIYNGSSTITDLAKELDLSVPTVTKFIDDMCDEGYIIDCGKLETNGGRHPNLYGLNADSGYFVGVELRQFSVNMGIMNFKGDMVQLEMDIPFRVKNTPDYLDDFCKLVKQFVEKSGVDKNKIFNINIDLSGRINPDEGYSYSIFNFSERPLTEIISEKIGGFRVSIDNDTRAMAFGEYMRGAVKGEKNIIFVNVSWGLGMGIIIDGKLYKGKSGFSGEFGHNYGYENEIICHCGKKGCIETEVSGSALHRILLEHIKNGENSIISKNRMNLDDLTLDEIIEAVNKEDLLCIERTGGGDWGEAGTPCGRTDQHLQPGTGDYRRCLVAYGRLLDSAHHHSHPQIYAEPDEQGFRDSGVQIEGEGGYYRSLHAVAQQAVRVIWIK